MKDMNKTLKQGTKAADMTKPVSLPPIPLCNKGPRPCIGCLTCLSGGIALDKLYLAQENKTGVHLTTEEFAGLVQESILMGVIRAVSTEEAEKLSVIFNTQGQLSSSKPGPCFLTVEESETLCAAFTKTAAWCDENCIDAHLLTWLKIRKPCDSHPLDGEMDSGVKYGNMVYCNNGVSDPCYNLSAEEIREKAKCYLFFMFMTLTKLKHISRSRRAATLVYGELCALLAMITGITPSRSETGPNLLNLQRQPVISAGDKIYSAIKGNRGATLTRAETLQILGFCKVVAKPKLRTNSEAREIDTQTQPSTSPGKPLQSSNKTPRLEPPATQIGGTLPVKETHKEEDPPFMSIPEAALSSLTSPTNKGQSAEQDFENSSEVATVVERATFSVDTAETSLTKEPVKHVEQSEMVDIAADQDLCNSLRDPREQPLLDTQTLPKYSEKDVGKAFHALGDLVKCSPNMATEESANAALTLHDMQLLVAKLLRERLEADRKELEERMDGYQQKFAAEAASLKQQINEDRAREEMKYNALREEYGSLKESAARNDARTEAAMQTLKSEVEVRDAQIKKLKEEGRTQIQKSKDRVLVYKKRYEDEVSNNAIQKLDFEVTGQMLEESKAEKEKLVTAAVCDKSLIAELKNEVGGLRAKQPTLAYDERKAAESERLKLEHKALTKDLSSLLLEKQSLETQIETLENSLAALKSLQTSTKRKLDQAIKKLAQSKFGEGEQVEELQDDLARERFQTAHLEAALGSAEDKLVLAYNQLAANDSVIETQEAELQAAKADYSALKAKLSRISEIASPWN